MSVRAWTSVADAGRLDRSTLGLPAEYGLACGQAVSDRAQGAAGVGERVELDGKIRQRLGSPQPEQPVPKAGRRCGLLFEELPGGGAQHAGAAEQEPVDLDDRNLAAAKPHHDEPALRCQRTQAVGDPVPSDRANHDVDRR